MKSYHVLIFTACVMVCLAILCWVIPNRVVLGDYTVKWPTIAQALGFEKETTDPNLFDEMEELNLGNSTENIESTVVTEDNKESETPKAATDTIVTPTTPTTPTIPIDSIKDSRIFLTSFYQSLQTATTNKVRVVHYGDSQIEEDRMTSQIRETLQDRFGGTGVGIMPLAQTIPSRSVKQTLIMNGKTITPQTLTRNIVYGPKRMQRTDGLYGVMGQVTFMNDSLVSGSEQLTTICTPIDKRPRYTNVQLFADSTITYQKKGDTLHIHGKGAIYGISQESSTGVIVDNIPMRGCLGLVFTKIDSVQLTQFYREENVTLIIMQFGGNAIPFNEKTSTIRSIVSSLRQQVRYIQSCAPHASILFIGPSDMLTTINGVEQSYPMVSYMDRLLHKMALEEHIAYFSLFNWMGGNSSMAKWKEIGLAGNDGIHFTRSGARKAGTAVAEWLIENAQSNEAQSDEVTKDEVTKEVTE